VLYNSINSIRGIKKWSQYATSYARRNRSNGSSSAFYSNQRLTPGRLPKKNLTHCVPIQTPSACHGNMAAFILGLPLPMSWPIRPAHRRWLPNICGSPAAAVSDHKLRHCSACSLLLSRHRLLRPLLRLHRLPLAPSPFIFPLTQVRLGTLGDAATADCVSYTLLSSAFLAQAPALRPPRDASVSSLPLILLPA